LGPAPPRRARPAAEKNFAKAGAGGKRPKRVALVAAHCLRVATEAGPPRSPWFTAGRGGGAVLLAVSSASATSITHSDGEELPSQPRSSGSAAAGESTSSNVADHGPEQPVIRTLTTGPPPLALGRCKSPGEAVRARPPTFAASSRNCRGSDRVPKTGGRGGASRQVEPLGVDTEADLPRPPIAGGPPTRGGAQKNRSMLDKRRHAFFFGYRMETAGHESAPNPLDSGGERFTKRGRRNRWRTRGGKTGVFTAAVDAGRRRRRRPAGATLPAWTAGRARRGLGRGCGGIRRAMAGTRRGGALAALLALDRGAGEFYISYDCCS